MKTVLSPWSLLVVLLWAGLTACLMGKKKSASQEGLELGWESSLLPFVCVSGR